MDEMPTMLRPSEAQAGRPPLQPTKVRKLRKGTHSCWQCKRRKMKCVFPSQDPSKMARCYGCSKRGSRCMGQEIAEGDYTNFDSLRTLDKGTADTPGAGTSSDSISILTPTSNGPDLAARTIASGERPNSNTPSRQSELSHLLYAALPSAQDVEKICGTTGYLPVIPYEVMTIPYSELDQKGLNTLFQDPRMPGPNDHPVLIARYMLLLATTIQHLHPDRQNESDGRSEMPRAVMERLIRCATESVTTNDELLGSIEGLECVLIESIYHSAKGNLRRSWILNRRALSIAQLMGLNRTDQRLQYQVLDPSKEHFPQWLWFRIVHLDRTLCLLLGLSQGSMDRGMASEVQLETETTSIGRLERIHCVVSSRILERNESHLTSRNGFALTEQLDSDLRQAAEALPTKWWLTPAMKAASSDGRTQFWEMRQLFAQLMHYNVLNQLHLPYMLRSSSDERQYEYSRITCINASREILTRFVHLYNINGISFSCRIIDFLTIMAAMTLLLAHLNAGHAENVVSHQHYSDFAMIEQVQEVMEEIHLLNSDALSAQSADLLRRLLIIGKEKSGSKSAGMDTVSVQEAGSQIAQRDSVTESAFTVHIPYFGTIKIGHQIPKNTIVKSYRPITHHPPRPSGRDRATIEPSQILTPMDSSPQTDGSFATPLNSHDDHSGPDPIWDCSEDPTIAADADQWAFQGIDLAFFESLVNGNEFGDGTLGA